MSWRWLSSGLLVILGSLVVVTSVAYYFGERLSLTSVAGTRTSRVFVSPAGVDEPGRGSARAPWRTINYALEQAKPGTTMLVQAGTYPEFITTARNGTAEQPITLQATGKVILVGREGKGRIMEIRHDYHVVRGFEFLGRDIQLWLEEADYTKIAHNYFHGAQGECVRIKYQSSNNVFEHNRVETCGQEDFAGDGDGKNGEGVYIGTAPEQLDRNPTSVVDHSNYNIVRHNTFNTRGNECVDIKEGAEYNISEFNTCTGQLDVESGGMDSRGNHNIFRYNRIFGNKGAGIRLGGDTAADGLHNQVYGNSISNNEREALKVMRPTQGQICGNTQRDNQRGLSNTKSIQNAPCPFPLAAPPL